MIEFADLSPQWQTHQKLYTYLGIALLFVVVLSVVIFPFLLIHVLLSFPCDSLWSCLTTGQTLYNILKHNDGCISEVPEGN
jgi:hypothetical protein